MKIYISLLISLFVLLSLSAQKKEHLIKLNFYEKFPLYEFELAEILDQRKIKSNIGFVHRGLANKRVIANFSDSLDIYLMRRLKFIIPSCASCPKLTLIIHEFEVSERIDKYQEVGFFNIKLEFARKVGEEYYSLGIVEENNIESKLDVTKSHSSRIIKGIRKSLYLFGISDWKDKHGIRITDLNQTKIKFSGVPKEGLYENYTKLCKNEHLARRDFSFTIREESKNCVKYYLRQSNSKPFYHDKIDYISDGDYIYMHATKYGYAKNFTRSKFIGRYIYFEDRYADPYAGMVFGIAGRAVSLRLRGIVLDTETGLVIELNDKKMKTILKDYPDVYQQYLANEMMGLVAKRSAIVEINRLCELKKQD